MSVEYLLCAQLCSKSFAYVVFEMPLSPPIYTIGGLREKSLSFAQAPQLMSVEAVSEVRAAEPRKGVRTGGRGI